MSYQTGPANASSKATPGNAISFRKIRFGIRFGNPLRGRRGNPLRGRRGMVRSPPFLRLFHQPRSPSARSTSL
jgi:hypothetical protein